jgi:hypothetical protein
MDPYKSRPWLGVTRFLLLLVFLGALYLLGRDMVRHRFFRGGAQDYNNWHNGSSK